MVHMMRYIRVMRSLPLILVANGSGILKWWVDSSFAVHPNMRGHSCGGFFWGHGFTVVSYTKQKINIRRYPEVELVDADDFMSEIYWTQYFIKDQGYGVLENVLFKDNRDSIILEKNGKASSSKRTKHVKIWYIFITDRVSQGDVSLVWCPTRDMIGDFMTKPLQGALFCKFRDQIMGVIPDQDPGPGMSQPGKAQTGNAQPGKGKPKKGKE